MSTSDAPRPSPRASAIHSLSWRLTITLSLVLVAVLLVFGWAANRQVQVTLMRAGGDRAQAVATQLSDVIDRTIRQSRDDLRQATNLPELHRLLQNPKDTEAADALRLRFTVQGAGPRRIEVWDDRGTRLLEVSRAASGDEVVPAFPEPKRPTTAGMAPLQRVNDLVFTQVAEEVRIGAAPQQNGRLGFLVAYGTFSVNPPGILNRLVGADAIVLFGNKSGDIWTDLTHIVPPPLVDLSHNGSAQYRAANGQQRLGALAEIRETPFAIWVEFSRDVIVAPGVAFLRAITAVGAMVVLLGATLVRTVTRRLTTPLTQLTAAAESIAAGNYAGRAPTAHRQDEIGRLSDAFNAMATHVETAHHGLEARVRERTAAVDALQKSEARNRAIVEVAFDCIVTIDAQGVVNEFNPAAERTFGYRRDEAVGRELASLIIPARLRDAHRQGLSHYLKTGIGPVIGKLIEVQALRADGSEFPAELAITEILGSPPMFTGVIRDITSRRAAEAALVESERAFRSTFDDAPLGIAQVGVDGKWIRVNRHLAAVLGWAPDELGGQTFLDFFHPDDPAPALSVEADHPRDREARVRRKDGQYVLVRLTISALRTVSGTPRHFIVILEDVSERHRLEERLRQSQKMEAIGRLAGGVAHDFNNLLTAILGYAQLLAEDIGPEDPKRNDVNEIIRATERSAALTGQLLAFSRKQVLKPTTLDLNALIRETSAMLRRLIGEHIELVTTLAADLKPVTADITQLEQIVINLAVNARDAMPLGGRLTIDTANVELDETSGTHPVMVEPGTYVMLAVNDTGVGMDAETRLRLFEPFFTTKEQGRGTGLGLATVYGIVKQSGGYIWVYSEPGRGASFRVYFPAASQAVEPPVRRIPPLSRRGTETILLVEDERAVRVMTRIILERCGYQVLEAATSDEAMQLFRAHTLKIALLITDVVMPGCHGPALYQQLAAERPAPLNVLYMSGYTDDEMIKAGRLERGADFIDKPFTAQKLSEKVREILDR